VAVLALLVLGAIGMARRGAGTSSASGLEVHDVTMDWPANPTVAAVHLQVTNHEAEPDALVGASSPIASSVMVHRTEVDDDGRATMSEAVQVPIAPRSTVTFEPNGLHVMVSGISEPVEIGDEVQLDLVFREAGTVTVTAEVVEPTVLGEHDHDEAAS
jgi:copper(I)-binding protein